MKSSYLSATAFACVAMLSLISITESASARGWNYHRTYFGHGRTVHTSGGYEHGGGQASGWHDVQGSHGHGYDSSFNRSCSNGTCTRNATLTTNNGNTWTRSGSISAAGDGTGSYSRVTTGPNGGEVTRSGSWSDPH